MTASLRDWFAGRTKREQRLLLLMVAIALPILAWLLVVRPLGQAYDDALQEQLEAVDRHGRVAALAEAAKGRPVSGPTAAPGVDLQLFVTESASQSGIALQSAEPADAHTIDVTVEAARTPAVGLWLREIEARGIRVQELRMTPQAGGVASLSARLSRAE